MWLRRHGVNPSMSDTVTIEEKQAQWPLIAEVKEAALNHERFDSVLPRVPAIGSSRHSISGSQYERLRRWMRRTADRSRHRSPRAIASPSKRRIPTELPVRALGFEHE